MIKNYELQDTCSQLAAEQAVAYSTVQRSSKNPPFDKAWEIDDAPCTFSPEELHSALLSSLEDELAGRVYSHSEVQSMINSRCAFYQTITIN